MQEKLKKLWLWSGIAMGLVSAGAWIYFLVYFFLHPETYIIVEEPRRCLSGLEILLQINLVTVLIYFLFQET